VVGVPVVVALIVARLGLLIASYLWGGVSTLWARYILVGRGGLLTLRTVVVLLFLALVLYASLHVLLSLQEARRRRWRRGRVTALGQGLASLLLIGLAGFGFLQALHLPTPGESVRQAEDELRKGWTRRFRMAVLADVPGNRDLCRRVRDGGPGRYRFLAAAGLYRNGDRGEETLRAIRHEVEDRLSGATSWDEESNLAVDWIADPHADSLQKSILNDVRPWPDHPFWAWWEREQSKLR
jgi:hypothetical protein